jgi:hypothetical protein
MRDWSRQCEGLDRARANELLLLARSQSRGTGKLKPDG